MKNSIATAALIFVVSSINLPWACGQKIFMGFDVFGEFGPSCLYGAVHSSATGEAKCETGRLFAGARLRLTRHDALEVSFSYSPDVFNEAYSLDYFNGRLDSHSFNYVRYLSVNSHLQPFATVGMGAASFFGDKMGVPSNESCFAWNYGVGVDLIPQRFFALRFELRDYSTTLPAYLSSGLHNVVPSIGIVFRFNRNRKL